MEATSIYDKIKDYSRETKESLKQKITGVRSEIRNAIAKEKQIVEAYCKATGKSLDNVNGTRAFDKLRRRAKCWYAVKHGVKLTAWQTHQWEKARNKTGKVPPREDFAKLTKKELHVQKSRMGPA